MHLGSPLLYQNIIPHSQECQASDVSRSHSRTKHVLSVPCPYRWVHGCQKTVCPEVLCGSGKVPKTPQKNYPQGRSPSCSISSYSSGGNNSLISICCRPIGDKSGRNGDKSGRNGDKSGQYCALTGDTLSLINVTYGKDTRRGSGSRL